MIRTNRTFLIAVKEKHRAISGSLHILKARRHALIMEFLNTSRPFLKSREEIKVIYREALEELQLSVGKEGVSFIESLIAVSTRDSEIDITDKNILGVKYKEIAVSEDIMRGLDDRNYDWQSTSPHLEETLHLFEKLVDAVIKLAAHELKLKKLGEEIIKLSRKTRVLEERNLPKIKQQIKTVTQHINEREREEFFRLKKFKNLRYNKHISTLKND